MCVCVYIYNISIYFGKGNICIQVYVINVGSGIPSSKDKALLPNGFECLLFKRRDGICLLACGKTAPAGRLQLSKQS